METANNYRDLIAKAERIDTTTGMNGYPRALRVAYTADTMGELRALKDAAEAEGHEVEVIRLHRRDGWNLWERHYDSGLDDDRWMGIDDHDWTVKIDKDSAIGQVAFEAVVGTDGGHIQDPAALFDAAQQVQELADALPDPDDLEEGEEVVCFLDPDNGWSIDYTVKTGQNGYSHDTHQYRTALLIATNPQ
jgi:hypothetical protein